MPHHFEDFKLDVGEFGYFFRVMALKVKDLELAVGHATKLLRRSVRNLRAFQKIRLKCLPV